MYENRNTAIFRLQADICKTLADPNRLMILHELRSGELSVGEIVRKLELPQSSVSRHLAVMREREIVRKRRVGTNIYYSQANPKIGQACDLVRDMMETYLSETSQLARSMASSRKLTGKGK
jgi:ArsR family transcriptional regulator